MKWITSVLNDAIEWLYIEIPALLQTCITDDLKNDLFPKKALKTSTVYEAGGLEDN